MLVPYWISSVFNLAVSFGNLGVMSPMLSNMRSVQGKPELSTQCPMTSPSWEVSTKSQRCWLHEKLCKFPNPVSSVSASVCALHDHDSLKRQASLESCFTVAGPSLICIVVYCLGGGCGGILLTISSSFKSLLSLPHKFIRTFSGTCIRTLSSSFLIHFTISFQDGVEFQLTLITGGFHTSK